MPSSPSIDPQAAFPRGRSGYWIFQAVFWLVIFSFTGLGILSASSGEPAIPLTPGQEAVFGKLLRATILQAWLDAGTGVLLGVGLTHALMGYSRRRDWLAGSMPALAGKSLTACALMALGVTVVQLTLSALLIGPPAAPAPPDWSFFWGALGRWLEHALEFAGWCALFYGFHAAARLTRLRIQQFQQEAAAKDARLEAIQAQLNPHFLFNSLNTVRGLIDEDPARARDAVTALAHVLRASLQSTQHRLIPLAEELSTVEAHLSLELARHGDRLTVVREIAPETLTDRVPPLLVQTLVENAVKHGIGEHPGAGRVRYAARREGDQLVLLIQNEGVLRPRAAGPGGGLGLTHARERLQLLYGPAALLTLEENAGQVTAQVRIPQNQQPSEDA